MTRRLAGVWVVIVALVALGATSAGAESFEGPQLTLSMMSFRTFMFSLVSVDPESSRIYVLRGPKVSEEAFLDPSSPAVWSPNGTELAVAAISFGRRGGDTIGVREGLFLLHGGRGKLRPISETVDGSHPVFSPDGTTLAFAKTKEVRKPHSKPGEKLRFQGSSVWLLNLAGGAPRQLTPWQNGLSIAPSSFSPDGQVLAATREAQTGRREAVALSVDGGTTTVLARRGADPTYSPDGTKIAYLSWRSNSPQTPTDVSEMNADGTGSIQLTETPKGGEIGLAWSPSGARLAFIRISKPPKGTGILGLRTAVVEMNADGTCVRTILSKLKTLSVGLSWRPGPGRDPGPISC